MSKKKPIPGRKNDSGKLRWNLLPFSEVKEIIRVLMHGAKKYGDYNWQKVPDAKQRYFNAAMRHITAWQGERLDKESGLSHLAHAACCLLFLLWFEREKE